MEKMAFLLMPNIFFIKQNILGQFLGNLFGYDHILVAINVDEVNSLSSFQ